MSFRLEQARLVSATLSAALALASTVAAAEPEPAANTEHAEHHHRFVVGANAMALGAISPERFVSALGAGAFFEVAAVPDWLEVELSAHYLRTMTDVDEIPVDILIKKPFHPLRWLNPYVGIGPTVVAELGPEEPEVLAGLAAVAGSYFWLTSNFGVSAELDYNLVQGDELVQEVAGLSGMVVGF